MWSSRFVWCALLVCGCSSAATTDDLESIGAPRRGYAGDPPVTGGGSDARSGDGGAGSEVLDGVASCSGGIKDLSKVGAGDFRISFHIATTQTGWAALMNQRTACGYGVFWDLRQSGTGTLMFELDGSDESSYETLESKVAINDGKLHGAVVSRVRGNLAIEVDGAPAGQSASSSSLGDLAPLRVTDDICVGSDTNPPTARFAGMTLSDICIDRGS